MGRYPCSSSKAGDGSSVVQTLVNARGKNATSTFDFPRKDERVTSPPAVDGRVKSGAAWPTVGTVAGDGAVRKNSG